MKCVNCSNELPNLEKFCFYYGVRAGSQQQGSSLVYKYSMNQTPIYDYVCPKCLKANRFKILKYFIILFLVSLFFLIIAIVFDSFNINGWDILFYILSGLLIIPAIVFLVMANGATNKIGDRIVAYNYLAYLKQKGYDTYQTREDIDERRFNPIM